VRWASPPHPVTRGCTAPTLARPPLVPPPSSLASADRYRHVYAQQLTDRQRGACPPQPRVNPVEAAGSRSGRRKWRRPRWGVRGLWACCVCVAALNLPHRGCGTALPSPTVVYAPITKPNADAHGNGYGQQHHHELWDGHRHAAQHAQRDRYNRE